jgi:acyl-CoA thioester hydrolase
MPVPEGQFLHQIEFSVRWGDMDALGHVNNIMYFQYFEQTRLAWYQAMGFAPLSTAKEGMVIVDNHAEYLKPIVYPMVIQVRMSGHSPGRSSFVSSYAITVDDVLYTRGSAKVVWVDTEAGKSIPLPDAVRSMVTTPQLGLRHHG